MATALANIRSARPRTPPTISAWYRTGTWLWKAGGPCRQAGQGVAGIGEAGVEACGMATAVKFKSREWQERLCQCAIAQLRGRPQGSAVIMRTPYALTRPPLVVTRLWFGVYSTRTSRAIKQNSISIANCPDWARRASEPSLRHLKRRDLDLPPCSA